MERLLILDKLPHGLKNIIVKEGFNNPLYYKKRGLFGGAFGIIVVRHPIYLTLSGIVTLPRAHPYNEFDCRDTEIIKEIRENIHTEGINLCGPTNEVSRCEEFNTHWCFGFSCDTSKDINPYILSHMQPHEREKKLLTPGLSYKELSYVLEEAEKLYELLRKVFMARMRW